MENENFAFEAEKREAIEKLFGGNESKSVKDILSKSKNSKIFKPVPKNNSTHKISSAIENKDSSTDSFFDNVKKSIEYKKQATSDFISALKKENLKKVIKFLRLENSEVLASTKTTCIYRDNEKLVIIDLDMWGDPVQVTTKTKDKVKVQTIKFFKGTPYFYPVFNEKNIMGDIIHAEKDMLIYNDRGQISIIVFSGENYNILNKKVDRNIIDNESKLISYAKIQVALSKNKNLAAFLTQHGIKMEDIHRLSNRFIIVKIPGNRYEIYIIEPNCQVYDQFILNKLPELDDEAFTLLFSPEIYEYAKEKGYSIDLFQQNGNYVEYYEIVGSSKICVLRLNLK